MHIFKVQLGWGEDVSISNFPYHFFCFSSSLCKSTESGNFIWNAEVKGELPEVCPSKYHKQNRNDLLEQFSRD